MAINNKFIQTVAFFTSTLAIAGTSHAFDFEVGDTKASVYGYAQLDLIYDFDNALGNTVGRGAPRLDGEEGSDGYTTIHAYQSRLGFRTASPVADSILTTVIEGDFYGDGGGELRLRHAYGEWNGILAGQTTSNFSSGLAGTPVVSFTAPAGQASTSRQAQLRYTPRSFTNFSVALEAPNVIGGKVDNYGEKSQFPDLTVRYTDKSSRVKYSMSTVFRYLEYDNAGTDTHPSNDSTIGWGVALEGATTLTEALTLRAGLSHGDGIGGYVHGVPQTAPAFASFDPVFVDQYSDLKTITSSGGTVGASLKVGPGSINTVYSIALNDLDDNAAYSANNHEFEQVWLNYIWSPVENISYGVEASWHKRELADGREGDATRLQGMVRYSF